MCQNAVLVHFEIVQTRNYGPDSKSLDQNWSAKKIQQMILISFKNISGPKIRPKRIQPLYLVKNKRAYVN